MSFQEKPLLKTTMDEKINDTKSALEYIDNNGGLVTLPLNTFSKVSKASMLKKTIDETLKHNVENYKSLTKQATVSKAMNSDEKKKPSNNNKSNMICGEDDSDDDVFIDENKAKKSTEKSLMHAEVSCDVTSSVTQQNITASTCVTNAKTMMPPSKTHNTNSRELTAAGETAVR